nr:MAG TPA: hypothetical protein [Caudoviricetes sp.]
MRAFLFQELSLRTVGAQHCYDSNYVTIIEE